MADENKYLTTSEITNEALWVLENELTFARRVNREYDDRFGVTGAKIGATVNVRRPARFEGTDGPALNVEAFYESSIPVTLDTQFHVDTQFNMTDRLLSLDAFTERVTRPAIATIGNRIDYDGMLMARMNVANSVGTPGQPLTDPMVALSAGATLDSEAIPRDGQRSLVLGPWSQATLANSIKGMFNPQELVSEVFRKGLLGKNTLGFDWFQDQNATPYTVGAQGGAPVFSTAGVSSALLSQGWADSGTLFTSGWAPSKAVLNVGDVIQMAGVYAVNPQNRDIWSNQQLRYFVVRPPLGTPSNGIYQPTLNSRGRTVGGTYTSDAAGNLQLTIAPCVIYAGQFQNVSAAPVNNAAITVFGAPGIVTPQSFAYHKNAFTLASADLILPRGVDFAGRASSKAAGLSLRIVSQYTVNNDALPTRIDVLYGWAPLYREMAVRIAG